MGARIEAKRHFVDHFIELHPDKKGFLSKVDALTDWTPFEKYLRKNVKRDPSAAGQPCYPDLAWRRKGEKDKINPKY